MQTREEIKNVLNNSAAEKPIKQRKYFKSNG